MGEYRTNRSDALPATAREKRAWIGQTVLIVLLVCGVIGTAGHRLHVNRYAPATGYVTTAHYAEVRAPVAARVAAISGESGGAVTAGTLIVQLEDAEQRASEAEAVSSVRKAEAEIASREAELSDRRRDHRSRVASAKLALDYAKQRIELTGTLAAKGLVSGRDLAADAYTLKQAEAEYARLSEADTSLDERQLEILRRELGSRIETVARARAAVSARAVRAPIDGRLLRHSFYVGEVVRPDTLLFEVFGGTNLVLKLRVPERYAAKVTPGQSVRAELRSFKTLLRDWVQGTVVETRDVIQTEGAQAYRVIYCSFDPEGRVVQPGATADAEILIGRTSFWSALIGL
ncbi:MAG: HlyD family efflux transporter periplasmic adaptor subunit [Lentisphaerae bacterium]|nr:HlyD family efflux transporter periplasmic adaptor subunit [Lentisphaerota bacterium]